MWTLIALGLTLSAPFVQAVALRVVVALVSLIAPWLIWELAPWRWFFKLPLVVVVEVVLIAWLSFAWGNFSQSRVPYAAALLNCYEDARLYQDRTLFQSSLPREIVYMTEYGSQQIFTGEAQVNESSDSIYQLSGEFFQCSLTNMGDSDLTEVSITFQNFYVNGWAVTTGQPIAFSINPQDRWIPVRAYTVSLPTKRAFEFALVNFGRRWSVFGIPKDFRNGVPPEQPILAYRIDAEGKVEPDRRLTLTRDARAVLSIPLPPAEKKATPWHVMDKCASAFLSSVKSAQIADVKRQIEHVPASCKKWRLRNLPLFGPPEEPSKLMNP